MKSKYPVLVAGSLLFVSALAPAIADEFQAPDHSRDIRPDGRGSLVRGHRRAGTQGAVTQGNGISYHGGPVMQGPTHVYFIWYGDWTKDAGANAILTDFANNIGGSPYFNINTTYGDNTGDVANSV